MVGFMWTLLAIVVVAWLLWVVVCLIALAADKLQKKRPPNAGFSVAPVIPLFPLMFIGLAWVIDKYASPWGTRFIGGLHLLLIAVYLVGIIYELRRMRSARRPAE